MATVTDRRLDRMDEDARRIDELIEARRGEGPNDRSEYRGRPVAYGEQVLGSEYWSRQREMVEAFERHPRVAVRSANSMGKNFAAADFMAYWILVVGGKVLYLAETDRQLDIGMGELRRALRASGVAYELYHRRVRIAGEDRLVAFTSKSADAARGFHAPAGLLVVLDEGQGESIQAYAYDAAFSTATGEGDRIVVLGNPSNPHGRFYQVCRKASWHSIKIPAHEHPNIREGRGVIRGGPASDWPETIAEEYGRDSSFYRSFVEAEFPEEATDALVTAEWADRAVDLHRSGALDGEARLSHYILGIDPARLGPDRTVVAVRRGPVVERFEEWRGADTMETADRVRALARGLLEEYRAGEPGGGVEAAYVDEVGLGGGVLDRLRETMPDVRWVEYSTRGLGGRIYTRSPRVEPFNAAKAAGLPDRFRNQRAQAYWTLRKRLEDGRLALPDLPGLREELLAHRVRFGADGRTEIESKDDVKARIGCSPDLADALVISLAPTLTRAAGRRKARWV